MRKRCVCPECGRVIALDVAARIARDGGASGVARCRAVIAVRSSDWRSNPAARRCGNTTAHPTGYCDAHRESPC